VIEEIRWHPLRNPKGFWGEIPVRFTNYPLLPISMGLKHHSTENSGESHDLHNDFHFIAEIEAGVFVSFYWQAY
jgi:hypothetical protein